MTETDPSAIDRMLRRIFGGGTRWERVMEGVSTEVYRIVHGTQRFYLRWPAGERSSFAAEAAVHTELRRIGVTVPEILHCDSFDEDVLRPVLITSEIPGRPMIGYGSNGGRIIDVPAPADLSRIYRAAGRDLALVNQVSVEGFGWIRDDHGEWPLQAEHRDFASWIGRFDAGPLRNLGFGREAVREVGRIVDAESAEAPARGRLAHGDFHVSHVFHQDGRYSGIIDFGDIQGSNGWHDLATFRLSDPELDSVEDAAVPHLEAGYIEVAGEAPDFRERVRGTAVTIMAERLTRQHLAEGDAALRRGSFRIFLHHLRRLLDEPAG
ncbi:phosphotransferase family protein [Microlunatus parietis]|uniref:Aminoglycoside phosphotransferase (APT) family kinase protein n=1 Tax=Microlunatus parietis TaxID=682979 RepID=A0A7Y9LBL0_9ACTN|nr:aminoglycoside phosphotransferase family protein [Microlunatus parietis]NYE73934.1 aminoglycoside phosphotransferase (APT) family kinase protein [Microlunatus parietis]